MELPNSNSAVETQFRNGFLGLLETLRFSIVLLHNELVRQTQINPVETESKSSSLLETMRLCAGFLPNANVADTNGVSLTTLRVCILLLNNELKQQIQVNANEAKSAEILELVDGKNNFITRIEHLKHNVAFQPEIGLKEMIKMIDEFKTLKADIIDVLKTKIADQNRHNPQLFFSPAKNLGMAQVLTKSIEQINQNRIEINGSTLQIHTASIPEEISANKLSLGTHTRG